ncbi:MAG: branched-chain amino acid ABC transporter permease [Thermodesulfobacteriota bacterium]
MFIQTIVNGLATGAIYALTVMGLVMIYKTTHVLNFAQGEKAMLTTFIAFSLMATPAIPLWAAVLLTLVAGALIGTFVELAFVRHVRARGATEGTYILIMLGLFLSIQGVAGYIWGNDFKPFPRIISASTIKLGGVVISLEALSILGVTFVLMLMLYLFFQKTRWGLAMRALNENLTTALLMGVRANRIFLITWGIACAMASIAGLMVVNITYLHPGMMLPVILKALAGAILGGFDSYPGVMLGCLLVGVMESIIGVYISTELKMVFAFALITLVLIVRPSGIMGKREFKKV